MPLTEQDIDALAAALAPKLVEDVRKSHRDFWIDPEVHYNDHRVWGTLPIDDVYELKQLIQLFKTTRALWFKAFIGAAIVGSLIFAGFGVIVK